ncbi:MAG: phosphoribosylanthranilate isomerase [Candidatus Omnitrophota bacterium]
MTKIKICGITNLKDAQTCGRLGADLLGFVFFKKSKRAISPGKAKAITAKLPKNIAKVGVFVNESPAVVKRIAWQCRLDVLQFHGDEDAAYLKEFKNFRVIKAVRVNGPEALKSLDAFGPATLLFDTFSRKSYGGTGKVFDWALLKRLKKRKKAFFVSGGLTPDNVSSLLEKIRPYGVDVSGGVEQTPGKKDHRLVKKFINNARSHLGH